MGASQASCAPLAYCLNYNLPFQPFQIPHTTTGRWSVQQDLTAFSPLFEMRRKRWLLFILFQDNALQFGAGLSNIYPTPLSWGELGLGRSLTF